MLLIGSDSNFYKCINRIILVMRILAASDLHSNKKKAEKLAKKAVKEKVDLVLLGGDIIEMGSTEGMIKPFKKAGIEVLMVHGNHDDPTDIDFLSKKYGKGVYNLHSYYKEFDNVVIIGAGGTDFTPFGLSNKDLFARITDKIKSTKKKTIILAHEPPFETKLDDLGWMNVGSREMRKLIENYNPDLVLCGHIHEKFGLTDYIGKTKIINTGSDGVIIDL
ncbi:hypothetical protein COS83_01145 [archaeon CG07_land_8_20_14_0_80_38_8]|nr:MAG: hypothetical protein COS83_01145 [archaeon CG07_land_8_20_14_0_80_38_8]PIU88588.1 MAG: hypothetical protein COS64_03055 [archaeon CG06_land_8_20_14_3_00_37_11]